MTKRTITYDPYEAEFFVDGKTALVHFVITRRGEAEVVLWGEEKSIYVAEKAALESMFGLCSVA